MSGKSVRCKSCGAVFRIAAPELDAPAPGDFDFDALEKSVSGESLETAHGTRAGPSIDGQGKVSIRRSENVADIGLGGNDDASAGVRSNFRYRFPFAKQIDQFLPWVLLIACFGILMRWCFTSEATGVEGHPSTGIALSRFFFLFGVYLILIWPIAHIALRMASRKLRFSMPKAALWRSFAGFTPLLLFGAGMYLLSGGGGAALIIGLLLGATVSVGAITLLFRLFPNEMPIVAAYASGGAMAGGVFSIATLYAINLVALSIANMGQPDPQSLVSPIAMGLKWRDPPAPTLAKNTKPTTPAQPSAPATEPTTAPVPETSDAPTAAPLQTVAIPTLPDDKPKLIRKLERPPVTPAFDQVVLTPSDSNAIAILRRAGGGIIELFNRNSWLRMNTGQGFDASQSNIVANTLGDLAVRLTDVPSYRLEGIALGRAKAPPSILLDTNTPRHLLGFLNDRDLLALVVNGTQLSMERYDIGVGRRSAGPTAFGNEGPGALDVLSPHKSVRVTPDGRSILLAGRANGIAGQPARLALYDIANVQRPQVIRDLPLNINYHFLPEGLAINDAGRVALLLNAGNETYYTLWAMRPTIVEGAAQMPPSRALVDRKLGVHSDLRPAMWDNESYDAMIWLNANTLLLFGTYVVDAETGDIIGETGLSDVVGQVSGGDNCAILIQRANGSLSQLLRVTFDAGAIKLARQPN